MQLTEKQERQIASILDDNKHLHTATQWRMTCSTVELKLKAQTELVHLAERFHKEGKAKSKSKKTAGPKVWKWWGSPILCGLFVDSVQHFDDPAPLCRVVPVAYTYLARQVVSSIAVPPVVSTKPSRDVGQQTSTADTLAKVEEGGNQRQQRLLQRAVRFIALLSLGHLHVHAGCVALAMELNIPLPLRTFAAATASLQRVLQRCALLGSPEATKCNTDGFKQRTLGRLCQDALDILVPDLKKKETN